MTELYTKKDFNVPANRYGDDVEAILLTEDDLQARIQELVNELPPRLRDIYTCLLEGLTNRRIARKLGISENTVRIYVSEVLHRLGHTSRTELIAAALGN